MPSGPFFLKDFLSSDRDQGRKAMTGSRWGALGWSEVLRTMGNEKEGWEQTPQRCGPVSQVVALHVTKRRPPRQNGEDTSVAGASGPGEVLRR